MTRLLASLFMLTAAPLVLSAEISTLPARLLPGQPFTVVVNDIWPNSCIPRSARVIVNARAIVLRANDVSAPDCEAKPTPYRFAVESSLPPYWDQTSDAVALQYGLNRAGSAVIARASSLAVIGIEPKSTAESGIYWNDAAGAYPNGGPGVGLSLDVQGQRASVTAFYYDLGGNPVWYFGSGDIRSDELALDLHLLRGGQSLLGDYRAPTDSLKIARLQIKFSSPSRLTALLTVPQGEGRNFEVQEQIQSLVRFAVGYGPESLRLAGRWAVLTPDDTIRLDLQPNPDGELIDIKRDYALRCGESQNREPPPERCELRDGRDRIIATFTQIGLETMRGRTPGLARVSALRLD